MEFASTGMELQTSQIADYLPTLCERKLCRYHRSTGDAISQNSVNLRVAITVTISKSNQRRPEQTSTIWTVTCGAAFTEYATAGFLILRAGVWVSDDCIHALAVGNHESQTE